MGIVRIFSDFKWKSLLIISTFAPFASTLVFAAPHSKGSCAGELKSDGTQRRDPRAYLEELNAKLQISREEYRDANKKRLELEEELKKFNPAQQTLWPETRIEDLKKQIDDNKVKMTDALLAGLRARDALSTLASSEPTLRGEIENLLQPVTKKQSTSDVQDPVGSPSPGEKFVKLSNQLGKARGKFLYANRRRIIFEDQIARAGDKINEPNLDSSKKILEDFLRLAKVQIADAYVEGNKTRKELQEFAEQNPRYGDSVRLLLMTSEESKAAAAAAEAAKVQADNQSKLDLEASLARLLSYIEKNPPPEEALPTPPSRPSTQSNPYLPWTHADWVTRALERKEEEREQRNNGNNSTNGD